MISVSSCLASSMPATSSKVTRIFSGSTLRARERPKLPRAPIAPPPAARRANRMKRPTSSIVGPKPSSNSTTSEVLFVVDLALISTFFSLSSVVSAEELQNVGISVLKSFVVVGFLEAGGYLTLALKVPSTALPVVEIDFTSPDCTCCRK